MDIIWISFLNMNGYSFHILRLSMDLSCGISFHIQSPPSYPLISFDIHRDIVRYPTIYPCRSIFLSIDYPFPYPLISNYFSIDIQVFILMISNTYLEISFHLSCCIFDPDSAGPACPGVQRLHRLAQATVFIFQRLQVRAWKWNLAARRRSCGATGPVRPRRQSRLACFLRQDCIDAVQDYFKILSGALLRSSLRVIGHAMTRGPGALRDGRVPRTKIKVFC